MHFRIEEVASELTDGSLREILFLQSEHVQSIRDGANGRHCIEDASQARGNGRKGRPPTNATSIACGACSAGWSGR